jgi:rRNA maturation endonuclease Nob1
MKNDMSVKTVKNPNIRCHNCGKEWFTKKDAIPKYCYVCHSNKIERFTELTDLKDKLNGTFPKEFPYKKNWGKLSKSIK